MQDLLVVAPFKIDAYGKIIDENGDRVITCNDELLPCTLYKEKMVDADAWFMCPKCGRLEQRMEYASPPQFFAANKSIKKFVEQFLLTFF